MLLANDIYFLNYLFDFFSLDDISKISRLCKTANCIVNINPHYRIILNKIKEGENVSKIFDYGSLYDLNICKLLYGKYIELVKNKNDVLKIKNQLYTSLFIKDHNNYYYIFNMANAFYNVCLNNNVNDSKWFTNNYSICQYNHNNIKQYVYVNKIKEEDINEIFLVVCEKGKYISVKWLFENFKISDLVIMEGFIESLNSEHFDISEYLFKNYKTIPFLINFNFDNFLNVYKNENKERIIKWLQNINNQYKGQ